MKFILIAHLLIVIWTWVSESINCLANCFLSLPTKYWLRLNACSNWTNWKGLKAVLIKHFSFSCINFHFPCWWLTEFVSSFAYAEIAGIQCRLSMPMLTKTIIYHKYYSKSWWENHSFKYSNPPPWFLYKTRFKNFEKMVNSFRHKGSVIKGTQIPQNN